MGIESFNAKLSQGRLQNVAKPHFVTRLIDARRPSKKSELRRPVFLVGAMRSGTTLLADFLGRSPHIAYCPFELKDVWSKEGGIPMASPKTHDLVCPECDSGHVTPGMKDRLTKAFMDRILTLPQKRAGAFFLNKNPHLCNKLPLVNALFPDARYIWIYRHLPRVVASIKKLFVEGHERQSTCYWWPLPVDPVRNRCWNVFHPEDARPNVPTERIFPGGNVRYFAEYWLESNRAVADFFSGKPPGDGARVSHEDLLVSPASELARLQGFLGIPLLTGIGSYDRLDKRRNDQWKGLLSDGEIDELVRFVEVRGPEINAIFSDEPLDAAYLQMLRR